MDCDTPMTVRVDLAEEMPTDPFEATPLVQPAAVTHELYESYLAAGFDRLAALYLVGIHVGTIGRFELERQAMAESQSRPPKIDRGLGHVLWGPALHTDPVDSVPGARCIVCGGPVYDTGSALECPEHPAVPPQLGGM